jgi:hypothetical protein
MDETKYDIIIGIHKMLSYVMSGSAVMLAFLNDYMSHYGAALGFFGWVLTFLLNWYYQQKRLELIKLLGMEGKCEI